MPRNTRNFWITLNVDGKQESIASGPRSKDGGFDLTIKVRDHGEIADRSIDIIGRVIDNKLVVKLLDVPNSQFCTNETTIEAIANLPLVLSETVR